MRGFNTVKSFLIISDDRKRRLRLFWNRQRTWVRIERKGKFFNFVLHERFRKYVKWFKYFLVVFGILSCFIVFANVIYALAFGLGLFLLQTLVEKTIFTYHAVMIMPFPDFEIVGEKWLGVLSGYFIALTGEQIPLVGMVFSDEDYARKMYKYVLSWNYGEHKDRENNIVASIVTNEEADRYVFYLYANPDRATAKQLFEQLEQERKSKLETFTDILEKNYLMLTLGKTCIVSPQSYLPTLLKTYKDGFPYYFGFYYSLTSKPGFYPTTPEAAGTKGILKFDLKVRKESELTRKDFEYEFKRDWHPDDSKFLGPKEFLPT